ncbi:peroxiredoxin [Blattabacterium cuenoti]|uniref:peroxiredoxin n=1 Tax=Blattabacterium cuenoti TaxID=1653831 RepID=UPI00163CBEC5|nr:peroxiredoxin [Blattabacterium cuenoti]
MNTLIAKKAPNFKTSAVLNGKDIVHDFTIEQFIGKKYVILFFYPKDFTFVCPTEIYAFQDNIKKFEDRNTQIIAVSTDTEYAHWTWLQIKRKDGGICGVTYPIVSDINKTISYNYGVLSGKLHCNCSNNNNNSIEKEEEMVPYRGLFLIDKKSIIRHILINDFPLGRNIHESLRMIDALQSFEKNGEVCPANWTTGDKTISANHDGIIDYFSS